VAKGLFRRVAEKIFPSRPAPARVTTQAAQVRDKAFGGSTKEMARAYNVSQRTVERWIDGTRTPPKLSKAAERRWEKTNKEREKRGQAPLPRPTTAADQLEGDASRVQITERGRERRAREAERAPAGFVQMRVDRAGTFNIQGSAASRPHTILMNLDPDQAAALVRAGSSAEIQQIAEEAVVRWFNGGGTGAGTPRYFRPGDVTFDADSIEIL
jgi:hypothetical protein